MDTDTVQTLLLDSAHDSRITNINLYPNRAQITRSYNVNVAGGHTKLIISGLPNVVDRNSLRVDGRGPAMIHGVTVFKVEKQQPDKSSSLLEELKGKKAQANNALGRCKNALAAVGSYIDRLSIEHLDISKLGEAMDIYDTTEEKWDNKILEVEKSLEVIDTQIQEERQRLEEQVADARLRTQVVIGLFAVDAAELQVNLIYAVSRAKWEASYDIRVDMQNPDALVKVVYKAGITQKTGENWENVPITLETAQPTFGLELPVLSPWHVKHVSEPVSWGTRQRTAGTASRYLDIAAEVSEDDEDDMEEDFIEANTAFVTSKGNINATFRVPGLTTIPSDNEEHGVTIANLELPATLAWVCIPKGNARVHLEANITNSSEFMFLPGSSNVYVDQSFIARSNIPHVGPKEVFRCPLGVDPSIRVTYHPQTKVTSEIGFYTKSLKHAFSQRITIHNTKSVSIDGLKITDQIPVSQDASLTVGLVHPALTIPGPAAGLSGVVDLTSKLASLTPPEPVRVSPGVVAQWNGADQPGCDASALGKNGRFDWVCAVPAHGKVNLLLEWEVTTSQKTEIYGL
ncbi:hypothetical protein GALMADRAFT_253935 [Galerina marginata CBS 339.88]|uniref:Mucoidy inhibitor A n=1 Tax=Galerina marginata (strain CBS 339.88) TaxID=685588 RepID=A0A067SL14_GALM3|nr:hypothetical protein GALMADRAFT_253935 [Galerina marginata CBS 339.88]